MGYLSLKVRKKTNSIGLLVYYYYYYYYRCCRRVVLLLLFYRLRQPSGIRARCDIINSSRIFFIYIGKITNDKGGKYGDTIYILFNEMIIWYHIILYTYVWLCILYMRNVCLAEKTSILFLCRLYLH